jgi:hypothetical protein
MHADGSTLTQITTLGAGDSPLGGAQYHPRHPAWLPTPAAARS